MLTTIPRGVDFDAPDYGYKEEDKPAVKVLTISSSLRFFFFEKLSNIGIRNKMSRP